MVGLGDDHSDLDIGLPEGTDDKRYGEVLSYHLPQVIDTFRYARTLQ